MSFLKRVWGLYIDIMTFEWLDRLGKKHPRLASAIGGLLVSLVFGLSAWYYLDPRFVIYERSRYMLVDRSGRIVGGGLFGIVSMVSLCFAIRLIWNDPIQEREPPPAAPSPPSRTKRSVAKPQKLPRSQRRR